MLANTSNLTTVVSESTVTMVKKNLSTVVPQTPLLLIGNKTVEQTSSVVFDALSTYGSVDDDALARLVHACKDQSPDCTDQEIVHFVHEKGRLVKARESRIQNPIGFLIDAVPKCFAGEIFRLRRQAGREVRADAEQDAGQEDRAREWGRKHESDLADPNVPEQVKAVIRRSLGMQ